MIEFEGWKNEILDSINKLHEEAKLIRERLEDDEDVQDVQEEQDEQDVQDEQEEQDDQDDQDVQEEQDEQDVQEVQETIIIQKLDDINDSINILNKTVVEGSLVVSISIVIALAFHYFVNQISKW